MIDLFEEDFQRVGYRMTVNKISAAMFFIALCYGGFRRFEMVCTDLGALRDTTFDIVNRSKIYRRFCGQSLEGSKMNMGYGDGITFLLLVLPV